jgi:predicted Ser/Thr protein kinase
MGVVHLARGPDGQRVALKVLRNHVVGDEEGRARLAREVSTLRRVRSPRVAEVYDADPWGEHPYVVTRYVPGQSLHELVKIEGTLQARDLRFLALGLAEAMRAVHEVGVVHRDIKPSNVLMEGRAPVLIDFGLAKLADDPRLTVTGWLMGTPGYLAPEVLHGDEPTPASDAHAWAATLVYAAAGHSPYGGGPAMAVMDRARRGEYDVSALPSDLRPLVERCLSVDPQRRPTSAELVGRLAHLQHDPVAVGFSEPSPPRVAHTRPLTVPVAAGPGTTTPPAPPQPVVRPAQLPGEPRQPAVATRRAGSGALRAAILTGLGAIVAASLALAPYVATLLLLLLVWLVRTASVSGDAHSSRQSLRGPRASDGVMRALAWPWHLFAAAWGSAALVLSGLVVGGVVAGFWAMLGQPPWRSVLLGGVAFALALWWGPGSTRLRGRVRRLVWRSATPDQTGVTWALAIWLVAVVMMIVGIRWGVLWTPEAGPPFGDLSPWW